MNLTTWSDQSSDLLLALAQAAAGTTAALMLARASGRKARPTPRGEVFRVYSDRVQPPKLSAAWTSAVATAAEAMREDRVVAVVGEPGAGKTALATCARRSVRPRERLLNARPPAPDAVGEWLRLWTPELGKADTCVVVSEVDALPAWAASSLAPLLTGFVLTATEALPEALAPLVDVVVEAPALRFRPDDVLPLAHYFAHRDRGREVTFTSAAVRALLSYEWPENTKQLRHVVRVAAARSDVVDVQHLPAEVFTSVGHRLSRLQVLERDEIVRCLTAPGATIAQASAELGIGRATIYRKMAQYGIKADQLRG